MKKDYFIGFRFFFKGVKSASREMWISLEVLVALTIVLSSLLYLCEHAAQPEVYKSFWDSFVWSFMAYLDNPGNFSNGDPVTLMGRILWVLISLVKIAIFAVPAGLIASGFSAAMAEDEHAAKMRHVRGLLYRSMSLVQSTDEKIRNEMIRIVPRYKSLDTLSVKLLIKRDDIMDAIASSDNLRLCNLATSQPTTDHPQDRLVVQLIPMDPNKERRAMHPYGCYIDRGSKVTIVAPTAATGIGAGPFGYYLAKFGGFNYISKEYCPDPIETVSFYDIRLDYWKRIKDAQFESESVRHLGVFLDDIKRIADNSGKWVIFIHGTMKGYNQELDSAKIHFETITNTGERTVDDEELMSKIFSDVNDSFSAYGICSEIDSVFIPMKSTTAPNLVHREFGAQSFSLRISNDLLAFDNNRVRLFRSFANILKNNLEPKDNERISWTAPGYGYDPNDFLPNDELAKMPDLRNRVCPGGTD